MFFEKTEPDSVPEDDDEPGKQTVLPATKSVQRNLDHTILRIGNVALGEDDAETGGETAKDGNAEDCPAEENAVVAEGEAERPQTPYCFVLREDDPLVPYDFVEELADGIEKGHSRGSGGAGWCMWRWRCSQTACKKCRSLWDRLPCLLKYAIIVKKEARGGRSDGSILSRLGTALSTDRCKCVNYPHIAHGAQGDKKEVGKEWASISNMYGTLHHLIEC